MTCDIRNQEIKRTRKGYSHFDTIIPSTRTCVVTPGRLSLNRIHFLPQKSFSPLGLLYWWYFSDTVAHFKSKSCRQFHFLFFTTFLHFFLSKYGIFDESGMYKKVLWNFEKSSENQHKQIEDCPIYLNLLSTQIFLFALFWISKWPKVKRGDWNNAGDWVQLHMWLHFLISPFFDNFSQNNWHPAHCQLNCHQLL